MSASWTHNLLDRREDLTISYENEGWTVQGIVSGIDIHYVIRLNASWQVRQMLLFRDLDQPDLWLANDGTGRWGEVNGVVRRELGGCEDVDVRCSAMTPVLAIRRLSMQGSRTATVHSVVVDPDSLEISRAQILYTRLGTHRWRVDRDDGLESHDVDVDRYGLPVAVPGGFERIS